MRTEVLPDFFKAFWQRRMALDRRNYRAVVETTVALAHKAGVSDVLSRVVEDLKVWGWVWWVCGGGWVVGLVCWG